MTGLPLEVVLERVLPLLPACTLLRSRTVCRYGPFTRGRQRASHGPHPADVRGRDAGEVRGRICACVVVGGLGR